MGRGLTAGLAAVLMTAGLARPALAGQGESAPPAVISQPDLVIDEQPSPSVPDAPQAPRLVDIGDLWRHARHKPRPVQDGAAQSAKRPFFFVSPSVTDKPSTGLAVGLASSVVFVAGDPRTTHISSADWSVSDSVKGQAGTSVRFRIFTPDNRWFFQGDNRLAWSSQLTYPLGIIPGATAEKLKFGRRRVYDTLFRRVTPQVLVGVGLNVNDHANVRAGSGTQAAFDQSAYALYSSQHGFTSDRQMSSGASIGVVVDTRDNSINASRGWFASTSYHAFVSGFLGGSSTWQLLDFDTRTYRSFGGRGRQKLAFWMLGEFVTGGTAPYLDLPAIADDTYGRSARGYTSARYRGPDLVYGEVEYRSTLSANGLLGAVLFVNSTAISSGTPDERLFSELAPAAGGGLRILLSKRSRANFCVDYGWGTEGSHGLYLAVREAF